jgi:hypothetical protein
VGAQDVMVRDLLLMLIMATAIMFLSSSQMEKSWTGSPAIGQVSDDETVITCTIDEL